MNAAIMGMDKSTIKHARNVQGTAPDEPTDTVFSGCSSVYYPQYMKNETVMVQTLTNSL